MTEMFGLFYILLGIAFFFLLKFFGDLHEKNTKIQIIYTNTLPKLAVIEKTNITGIIANMQSKINANYIVKDACININEFSRILEDETGFQVSADEAKLCLEAVLGKDRIFRNYFSSSNKYPAWQMVTQSLLCESLILQENFSFQKIKSLAKIMPAYKIIFVKDLTEKDPIKLARFSVVLPDLESIMKFKLISLGCSKNSAAISFMYLSSFIKVLNL
ncbi:MAG: hypothetical protein ACP5RP_00775 [Candidatus Micrarchaeia archaeon]